MNSENNTKQLYIACIISALLWQLTYWFTVSYESTFVTICIIEIVGSTYLYKKNYRLNIKESRPYILLASVVSFLLTLADYGIFISEDIIGIISGGTAFLSGIIVFSAIFICADYLLSRSHRDGNISAEITDTNGKKGIAVFGFCFPATVDLLYLFLCCYPGYLNHDSVVQIMMGVIHEYDNHHPYWHTKLIEWIFLPVYEATGNGNLGVALFCVLQIIAVSLCVMYLAVTLYEMGLGRKWAVGLTLLFGLMPYNIAFASTITKDTPFATFMLLLSVALYRRVNDFDNKVRDYILLAIGAAGGCIFRTNGKIAIIILLIVLLTVYRKHIDKKVSVAVLAGIVFAFMINNLYLAYINIEQPDVVESLSIPLQQIARCSYDESELTADEQEFVAHIGDYRHWGEIYDPECSDNIKLDIRDNDRVTYIEEHKLEFITNWISIGIHNPYCYFKAWVDETSGFWSGSYGYSTWDNEMSDVIDMTAYNIYKVSHNIVACRIWDFWNGLFVNNRIPPLEMVMAIGLRVFVIMFCAIWAWRNNRKNSIMCVCPLAIELTLVIATPLNYEFRYAYMIFTTFIIVVIGCLYTGGNQEKLGDILDE